MTATEPVCYRHPSRVSHVRCTRCGRPMCPDCMRSASVGHQCVDCVMEGAATVRQAKPARTRFGAVAQPGTPVITYGLIAVNVVMFALQSMSTRLESALVMWTPGVADGELYRLATSAFLHFGVAHLLFNMLALFVIGPQLEYHFGRWRYVTLYALSALGGSVLVYLLSPLGVATAGASGAVFGLFGAALVVARRLQLDMRAMLVLIGLNLVFTFVIPLVTALNISWQGHVGGLLVGGAVAAAFGFLAPGRRGLVHVGAALAVAAVLVALIMLRTQQLLGLYVFVG